MQAVLQALLNLQEIDQDIFRTQMKLKRLPAERMARRGEIDKRLARLAEMRKSAKERRVRVKEIEDETTVQRQRVRKVESEAAGSRADMALLVAYQHEIRTLKRTISTAEEEGLGLLERVEAVEAEAKALEAEIAGEERLFAELSGNIELETAAAERKLAGLEAERARRMKGDIPTESLALYTRLLAAREGVATAELDGRICQACYMEIPTNLCVRIARGSELVQCPSCDRILHVRG